ncbi:MAG: HAMP domain-containing protein [Chloroflexi bacterium]|nr:HAMP domain-containing protein [Chloroflexota bacterium]
MAMLGSLRARLVVSFAVVVALAVFLAGAGALFLLRDQQQEAAREHYGRLAEPLAVRIGAMESRGDTLADIEAYMTQAARDAGVRTILLDEDLLVLFDSDGKLNGKYILSFDNKNIRTVNSQGTTYKWTNFDQYGDALTLFTAPPRPDSGSFVAPPYEAVIAIPQSKLGSAWLELVPRLALAGAIALAVSVAVSYFISRSISGPLARITQASIQMSRGNYDVHIPIRGEDEVGRLSEAFNAMAKEVNSSQRMMKDLLANVSHELKTPLTSIQGYSQAMLDGAANSPEDLQEASRVIFHEAMRMRALVDDLLLLSQIESGQVAMQHTHVSIGALLERMLERFQWSLRDAEITAQMRIDATVPQVHGDERRLEQVFSNLIENAVRHTPAGGTVTIAAANQPDGSVRASVHNTGSFIPAEDQPRVFERFFQVDRARARKEGGRAGSSGLGLAIVAEIMEAHGGTVRAVSDATAGTEFVLTFPDPRRADVKNGRVTPQPRRNRIPPSASGQVPGPLAP